ncbi:MAG: hypothetical protein JW881_01425 [Spirochaetales bacterium]|nr:hypothetical protein [Spirochaetales bacterium]
MNKIQVESLQFDNINLILTDTDDGIMLSFEGTIDMEYPQSVLDDYFDRIHVAVIEKGIKTVYCNLENLRFINSSGIRCVIKWLLKIKDQTEAGKQYRLVFCISNQNEWQLSSLGFLKELCPSLIQLQEA